MQTEQNPAYWCRQMNCCLKRGTLDTLKEIEHGLITVCYEIAEVTRKLDHQGSFLHADQGSKQQGPMKGLVIRYFPDGE